MKNWIEQATAKIVFLEYFLGNATLSHSGGTNRKTMTKALDIKMTWGKTVYSGLKESSASFWQLYSQAFFRNHWLLKQYVMDGQQSSAQYSSQVFASEVDMGKPGTSHSFKLHLKSWAGRNFLKVVDSFALWNKLLIKLRTWKGELLAKLFCVLLKRIPA